MLNINVIERLKLLRHMTAEHRSIIFGLKKDQVAIDCGANVGVVARAMASRGAAVYAFEPNPYAFKVCEQKCRMYKSVTLFPKAVGTKADTVKLFLHEEADKDQVAYSQGSSLLSTKLNVNPDTYCEVESVDLAAFILGLGTRVNLLKMDIEGFEVEVIPHLINTKAIDVIDLCLVELHERKAPELLEKTVAMRALIDESGLTHKFVLDWH
ncbi:MAG: FkbM family methyltransferase [Pseudobdellovibrionaceae bacterium]